MKLSATQFPVQTYGIGEVIKSKIDTRGRASGKLQVLFRDKIYTHKMLAPVREVICNAIDIHTVTGQTRPMEIYAPNNIEPTFVVRDFGTGLNADEIEVFCTYLISTKDEDNEQIGGFGLGSKAPFAYTDQFTVKSYQNGEVSTWAIFIDSDGEASRSLADLQYTDEPDGIEIRVPVLSKDIYSFTRTIENFLIYTDPATYNLHGGTVTPLKIIQDDERFMFTTQSNNPVVLIGPVAYPIPGEVLSEVKIDGYNAHGIIIKAPIGACDVGPSREQLSMDEATRAFLVDALTYAITEIQRHIYDETAKAPTVWDKIAIWSKIRASHRIYTEAKRPDDLPQDIEYKSTEGHTVEFIGRKGGPARWSSTKDTLHPKRSIIILWDVEKREIARINEGRYQIQQKATQFGINPDKRLVLLKKAEIDRLQVPYHLKLSDFPLPDRKTVNRTGRRVYEWKDSRRHDNKNWNLIEATQMGCEFLWVPFKGSDPDGDYGLAMAVRNSVFNPNLPIYGINKANMDILTSDDVDDARTLREYLEEEISETLQNMPDFVTKLHNLRRYEALCRGYQIAGLCRLSAEIDAEMEAIRGNLLDSRLFYSLRSLKAYFPQLDIPIDELPDGWFKKDPLRLAIDAYYKRNPILQLLQGKVSLDTLRDKDFDILKPTLKIPRCLRSKPVETPDETPETTTTTAA